MQLPRYLRFEGMKIHLYMRVHVKLLTCSQSPASHSKGAKTWYQVIACNKKIQIPTGTKIGQRIENRYKNEGQEFQSIS